MLSLSRSTRACQCRTADALHPVGTVLLMGEPTNQERARALRRAGLSRRQIADALGLKSGGSALSRWLKDIPPPEWTRRPDAKDDIRAKAEAMRRTGMSYREIQAELGVSTSSLSLWLRDIPLTDDEQAELDRRHAHQRAKAGVTNRARRLSVERNAIEQARAQIPAISESELFVAGWSPTGLKGRSRSRGTRTDV